MICPGCKKSRDLGARGLCQLCSLSAGEARDLAATLRDRDKIKTLQNQVKDLVSDLSAAQARADLVEAALASPPIKPIQRREKASGNREATMVVHFSDWHIGEVVDPEKVNGLNRFDLTIAEERIERCTDAIAWMTRFYRSEFSIRDLVVILGGDLMTGHIHEELLESNSLSPTEEVLWLLPRLEKMLKFAGEELDFAKVDVLTCWGNHGRSTPDRRISTAAENSYEWLIYQILNRRFAGHDVVSVMSTKSAIVYHRAYDFVLRAIHGDELSYQGGVGGLTIPLNKALARWDVGTRADCTWVGHWHQYQPGLRAMINGSLKGYDPYSLKRSFSYERPQQSVALIDSRRGVILPTPIWLDDVDTAGKD